VVLALPLPIIFADQPLDLDDESQRALFHAGNRALMGRLYQESYDGVDAAVGRVLCGADRETVVHDLYLSVSRNCRGRAAAVARRAGCVARSVHG